MSVNISDIKITIVSNQDDFDKAIDIRYEGYKKYFNSREQAIDEHDKKDNVHILLAVNKLGEPIGTMRLMDRRGGEIELDNYLNISNTLPEYEASQCIEAARFSVPKSPRSRYIKLALFKALYLYCLHRDAKIALIWVRNSAAREYERLWFDYTGMSFIHPIFNGKKHHIYKLNIKNSTLNYKSKKHPLYEFFCIEIHNNIIVT